jgi:hypothetical protein
MEKTTFGRAVYLEWLDSTSLVGWQYNPLKPRNAHQIKSLGLVVQDNDNAITITTSLDMRGASVDDLVIPKGAITHLEMLPGEWSLGGMDEEDPHGKPIILKEI